MRSGGGLSPHTKRIGRDGWVGPCFMHDRILGIGAVSFAGCGGSAWESFPGARGGKYSDGGD